MWSIYLKNTCIIWMKTGTNPNIIGWTSWIQHLVSVTKAIEKKFQLVIHHHENIIKSAQHHWLAPRALPHNILDSIIFHVVQFAAKKNLVPFAPDLFQIEVSHLYTPATNEFTLILHVPMGLKLKSLVSVWISSATHSFQLRLKHLNHSGHWSDQPPGHRPFKIVSNYSQLWPAFMSPPQRHFHLQMKEDDGNKLKKSCLGALYLASSDPIQSNCWFMISEAREKIFELSENPWAVYSFGTINTNEVCSTTKDITSMQIQSWDTVKIRPGCYIRTMDHMISADESETIQIPIKALDWPGEITNLYCNGNKETIHQAVQGLQTKYSGEFDTAILLDKLDHMQVSDPHWAFTSPAAMIAAAICTFAVGLCIWKICCWSRETLTPTPSAPPMPIQVIALQPVVTPVTIPATVKKQNR
jgi:hypothetical protein